MGYNMFHFQWNTKNPNLIEFNSFLIELGHYKLGFLIFAIDEPKQKILPSRSNCIIFYHCILTNCIPQTFRIHNEPNLEPLHSTGKDGHRDQKKLQ